MKPWTLVTSSPKNLQGKTSITNAIFHWKQTCVLWWVIWLWRFSQMFFPLTNPTVWDLADFRFLQSPSGNVNASFLRCGNGEASILVTTPGRYRASDWGLKVFMVVWGGGYWMNWSEKKCLRHDKFSLRIFKTTQLKMRCLWYRVASNWARQNVTRVYGDPGSWCYKLVEKVGDSMTTRHPRLETLLWSNFYVTG